MNNPTLQQLEALEPGYYWIETIHNGYCMRRIGYIQKLDWKIHDFFCFDGRMTPLKQLVTYKGLKIESVKPPSFL